MHNRSYKHLNNHYARKLRHDMTDVERRLWFYFLRSYRPKFYRQRPIGKYIVDFYCSKAKLIIELDGGQHYDEGINQQADLSRTKYFIASSIKVIRIPNNRINSNFNDVCEYIDKLVNERIDRSPS